MLNEMLLGQPIAAVATVAVPPAEDNADASSASPVPDVRDAEFEKLQSEKKALEELTDKLQREIKVLQSSESQSNRSSPGSNRASPVPFLPGTPPAACGVGGQPSPESLLVLPPQRRVCCHSFLRLQHTGFQYSTHFLGEYPTTKLPALEPGSGLSFDVCIAQAGGAGLGAFNIAIPGYTILGTYVGRVPSKQNRDENSEYEFEVGSHYVDAAQEGNWTRFLNLPSNEDKANVVAMSNATEIEHYAPSALITFIKSLGEHEAVLMVKGDRRILPGQQLIMFYGEDYRREMYKKDRISRNILDEAAEVRLGTPPKERVTLERGEFSSEEFDLMNTPVRNFPDDLKRDRQFVLAAVAQDGQDVLFAYQLALQFADDSLKRDKDVVPAAVAQNGFAPNYADNLLKQDKEVVLAAVAQDGFALQFADVSFISNENPPSVAFPGSSLSHIWWFIGLHGLLYQSGRGLRRTCR